MALLAQQADGKSRAGVDNALRAGRVKAAPMPPTWHRFRRPQLCGIASRGDAEGALDGDERLQPVLTADATH